MPPDPRQRPLLIGSEIYRHSTYGPKHPLAIPRVSTALDLIRALGWLPAAQYLDSPRATPKALARFHHPDYVAALLRAEATQRVDPADRERFHIGAHGNPVYREVFRRPATGAGGAIMAAHLTREGGIVHVPGAGTHHGRPDRASGFCYLNDPVLGLLAWCDLGLGNILYVDIDAHHGDGVQDAFHDDGRVFTLSVHETDRWPRTGPATDRAGGHARNLPVPAGFNDTEMAWVLHHAILPIAHHLMPDAIMLQCGADALEEDPLSRLSLSNNAHWSVVRALMPLAPRLVVLGGGGYNPYTVGRCWAGVWATLNHLPVPERLPAPAEAVLRALRYDRAAGRDPPAHWCTTLRDSPRPGPVREAVRAVAALAVEDLPPPPREHPAVTAGAVA
ncbi:acetoin utilization protein AcuC [Roseomonas sp. NAR14]|uniref:Acetoin utilization protein AcuC n=1 Tax=Roseomonas acroporae TaxID=2937791 RepID=A0A9X1Y609_9PROT|nr:acetoin utilization protein AcuC [Roseomonas acroporae]MCK8783757.1 acetoin utilization protein AcuC [Roseomonas acroporae]